MCLRLSKLAKSCQVFFLVCTKEECERYLRAVGMMKPVRGAAIKFMGSATARPLESIDYILRYLIFDMHCTA